VLSRVECFRDTAHKCRHYQYYISRSSLYSFKIMKGHKVIRLQFVNHGSGFQTVSMSKNDCWKKCTFKVVFYISVFMPLPT